VITKNSWFRNFLVTLMVSVITFSFTVVTHYRSIEKPSNMLLSTISSIRLNKDIPSALAQQTTPPLAPSNTLKPTLSPSPSPEQNKQSQSSEQDKKSLLNEGNIVIITLGVLTAVLVLLVMLLSPIVGTLDKATLQEKGKFLSESFPSVLQGVTVLLIVMIVALLTLVRVVNEQGAISILSALIGYVLGKRATELEYQQPPGRGNEAKPTDLKITPKTNQVNSGKEVEIEILPPQAVEANIQLNPPNTGTARVKDRSAIVYKAPTVTTNLTVTITVTSKDNPSLKSAQTTIDILP